MKRLNLSLMDKFQVNKQAHRYVVHSTFVIISGDVLEEFFSGQLQCAICKEIYIHPTVLNCGHIYCYACINHWHDQKHAQAHNCPMCRSDIIFFTRNPVLHVFVEKFIETFFQKESKRARRKIVEARGPKKVRRSSSLVELWL